MSSKWFKNAYLHVGLGKTGTSTIQRILLENAELLEAKHNIHFPCQFDDPRPFAGNHTLFMTSLFGLEPELMRANVIAGFNTAEKLQASNEKISKAFQLSFETSAADQLLISAEGIGHFHQENIAQLNNWLCSFANRVTVIACVRNPLHAIASEVQQRVKTGSVLEDLYQNPPYYPFKNLFNRLENVFGKENIIAYDFGKAKKNPHGITGAFLETLGLNAAAIPFEDTTTNESMSHEAVLLLSALNKQYPSIQGNQLGNMRSAADIRTFQSIPGKKFSVPKDVIDQLHDKVAPELQWLQENYGLTLEDAKAAPSQDYYRFSQQSIADLAVKVSRFAKLLSASHS